MPARFSARRPMVRGPKRQTVWIGVTSGTDKVTVAAASAVLLASLGAAALALRPFTITRMRGTIIVASDQGAANEEPQLVIGNGVFSDTAVAAGAASLPDPVSNPDGDWFMFEDVPDGFHVGATGVDTIWSSYQFDSKAKRKVGLDDDVALVVANNSAADGGLIILSGRMLLKLH